MLWADLGFTADGYWSDFCRAGIVGGPTPQQVTASAASPRRPPWASRWPVPGVATADIARAMRAALARLGLPSLGFGRLGHGIGLTATEPPSVVEHDPTILEAGMVITCEPAAVDDDGLYCTEQIIVVGDTPEVLSAYPTDLATSNPDSRRSRALHAVHAWSSTAVGPSALLRTVRNGVSAYLSRSPARRCS